MSALRNRRRVAIQGLYQLDNSGPQDESLVSNEAIREFIEGDEISESSRLEEPFGFSKTKGDVHHDERNDG